MRSRRPLYERPPLPATGQRAQDAVHLAERMTRCAPCAPVPWVRSRLPGVPLGHAREESRMARPNPPMTSEDTIAMPRPTAAQLAYGSCTVIFSTLAMLLLSQTSSGLGVAVIALAALALGLLV